MNTCTVRFDREFIIQGVREDVAACLAIEPEKIELWHNFFHDLGGESIDDMDLIYRSEKRFGIRSLFSRLLDPECWRIGDDGKLAAKSVQRLQQVCPRIDWKAHLNAINFRGPQDIMTIELFVDLFYYAAQFEQTTSEPPDL